MLCEKSFFYSVQLFQAEEFSMENFSSAPLSSSHRPLLLDGEVEIRNEDSVSVLMQNKKTVLHEIFGPGLFVLTNIRLITIQRNSNGDDVVGWGINLESVSFAEDCAKVFTRSTRILICLKAQSVCIGLKFREGKDDMLELINKALEKKSWENLPKHIGSMLVPSTPIAFSSADAGVSGIIRRQERNMQSVDNLAKAALCDLDILIHRAKEAIAVIQRYAAYHNAEQNGQLKEESASETKELENILQNIGIVSPVTKFSAGRLYHEQLARQTAEILFCENRLLRLGGMITLTDLYCLLNRARGAVLLSPEDLLESAELMKTLCLGLHLRQRHRPWP